MRRQRKLTESWAGDDGLAFLGCEFCKMGRFSFSDKILGMQWIGGKKILLVDDGGRTNIVRQGQAGPDELRASALWRFDLGGYGILL